MDTPKEDGGAAKPREREPWVYRCERHNYVLEMRVPKMPTSLGIFCPLCKDEFFAQHIPELQNENPNAGKFKDSPHG